MTQQEFEHIVPEMREVMLAIGRDFFGNEMDAEDVAQDGLLQLWRYCEQMPEGRPCKALSVRVAKHCCIDIMRRRRATIDLETTEAEHLTPPGMSTHPSPHEELESQELKLAIEAAIQRLAPSERRLFTLRQLEGLTLDEITELTRIPKTSVKSIISAARRKMYEALKLHRDSITLKKHST